MDLSICLALLCDLMGKFSVAVVPSSVINITIAVLTEEIAHYGFV